MKNMLKCSSLIRMAIIMIVMAFMAGQASDTYAGKKCKEGNHRFDKKGKCKVCNKIVIKINNNGHGNNHKPQKVIVTNWDDHPCCNGKPWQAATVTEDQDGSKAEFINETLTYPKGMILKICQVSYFLTNSDDDDDITQGWLRIDTNIGSGPSVSHYLSNFDFGVTSEKGNNRYYSRTEQVCIFDDDGAVILNGLIALTGSGNPRFKVTVSGILTEKQ